VQVVRTLGCKASSNGMFQNNDFAPHGEYSFLAAFKKMVKQAKRYIYLEDQFIFYPEAMQAVADALPNVDKVVLVTDNATAFSVAYHGIDINVASDMRYYRQDVALAPLMHNATLAKKVHIFELAREGYPLTNNFSKTWLYTHAKNYIVDDTFMLVGSHGIERTGFTNDVEVSVGLTDGTEGPHSFVGAFRRAVWGEHLQLAPDSQLLMDPMAAIAEYEKQAATGNARVRSYYPLKKQDSFLEDRVYGIYEPDGRCGAKAPYNNVTLAQWLEAAGRCQSKQKKCSNKEPRVHCCSGLTCKSFATLGSICV